MEENSSYVLPSDSEKLSHKFILDAITRRRDRLAHVEVETETRSESEPVEALPEPTLGDAEHSSSEITLPDAKQYFRIGEVSELLGVEAHVLRYWESEFTAIRPSKAGGQRVYRRKDVEMLHLIRHLLHVERFSIKGAKRKLQERRHRSIPAAPPVPDDVFLKELAQSLRELIRLAQP